MKTLCIVPARGGSKRFPNKNISKLGGKPLIHHTLDVATKAFDKVLFTSDSKEILEVASEHGADNLLVRMRPAHLATDTSKVIDTVNHYFEHWGHQIEQIWLCLPTCPLKSLEDLENAKIQLTDDVDGVLSITEYEFPPALGLNRDYDNIISDWHESKPWLNNNTRSQDHEVVYRPNGAFYGMWSESFKKARNFYLGDIRGVYMPRKRSVDIDTIIDFKLAQILLEETE